MSKASFKKLIKDIQKHLEKTKKSKKLGKKK